MTTRVHDPTAPSCAPEAGASPDAPGASFQVLWQRLHWRNSEANAPLRTLGLIGCAGGEGVSTVAVRLAVEAARTGREPVLLVDAHLRRPTVHRLLGVKTGPGLAEALRDGLPLGEILQPTSVARLTVLAAGATDADPAFLEETPGLDGLLETLKDEFGLIVLDLPPAAQSCATVGLLDGVILVAAAERTGLESVRREKERLEAQTRLLGVVLNQERHYLPAWLDRLL